MAVLVALSCAAIAIFLPGTASSAIAPTVSREMYCWILLQSATLSFAAVLPAAICLLVAPRWAMTLGTTLLLLLPVIMIFDAVTFRWTGERFLSAAVWRLATELRAGLVGHVTARMLTDAAALVALTAAGLYLLQQMAQRLATTMCDRRWLGSACGIGVAGSLVLLILGALPLLQSKATLASMAQHSGRHPLCVFRLLPDRSVIPIEVVVATPTGKDDLQRALLRRHNEQRLVSVQPVQTRSTLPDVLIVVIESFRSELVDDDVMPSLSQLAAEGLHCQTHFSGGNATSHGMFSLFNGLEAVWFQRPVTYSPLLNRLFRHAGYEIGFFAGHDDWRLFMMDGFIDPQHFDVFECVHPNGLLSDRHAVVNASRFLARQQHEGSAKPRLAILYLYATHAVYQSYVEDQVFQPAADRRLIYPYSDQMRDQVWNRYRNSGRTVDRFLKSLLRDDRVILVTGDHGESFLEDGTIGHGIRISSYQNMTPAILYAPQLAPRKIRAPTSHIDLLPTLLDLLAIPITHPRVFDGVSLCRASDQALSDRCFLTRNYLDNDYGLIGPWSAQLDAPYAYRVLLSLDPPQFRALNAINAEGIGLAARPTPDSRVSLQRWISDRFPVQTGDTSGGVDGR